MQIFTDCGVRYFKCSEELALDCKKGITFEQGMVKGCGCGTQLRGCCTRLGEIIGGLHQCGSS